MNDLNLVRQVLLNLSELNSADVSLGLFPLLLGVSSGRLVPVMRELVRRGCVRLDRTTSAFEVQQVRVHLTAVGMETARALSAGASHVTPGSELANTARGLHDGLATATGSLAPSRYRALRPGLRTDPLRQPEAP